LRLVHAKLSNYLRRFALLRILEIDEFGDDFVPEGVERFLNALIDY
jgi:hypothetical protein